MLKWSQIIGLALLSGGMALSGPVPELFAATSASLVVLPIDSDGEFSDRVEIGRVRALAAVNAGEGKSRPTGNPLWSIPLSALAATRERPIFSASRRPPQP